MVLFSKISIIDVEIRTTTRRRRKVEWRSRCGWWPWWGLVWIISIWWGFGWQGKEAGRIPLIHMGGHWRGRIGARALLNNFIVGAQVASGWVRGTHLISSFQTELGVRRERSRWRNTSRNLKWKIVHRLISHPSVHRIAPLNVGRWGGISGLGVIVSAAVSGCHRLGMGNRRHQPFLKVSSHILIHLLHIGTTHRYVWTRRTANPHLLWKCSEGNLNWRVELATSVWPTGRWKCTWSGSWHQFRPVMLSSIVGRRRTTLIFTNFKKEFGCWIDTSYLQ